MNWLRQHATFHDCAKRRSQAKRVGRRGLASLCSRGLRGVALVDPGSALGPILLGKMGVRFGRDDGA